MDDIDGVVVIYDGDVAFDVEEILAEAAESFFDLL